MDMKKEDSTKKNTSKDKNTNGEGKDPTKLIQLKTYVSPREKKEIYEYMNKIGEKNFSAFNRMTLRIYMHFIRPIDSALSLNEKLSNIEVQIEEMNTELKKKVSFEDQMEMIKQEQQAIALQQRFLKDELALLDPARIPQYAEIKKEILKLLAGMPQKTMKEFVLMNVLRQDNYDERNIWLTLTKLELDGHISFDKRKGELTLLKT